MTDGSDLKVAHLQMIQGAIARMASNSFALKSLSVTLSAGVIALLSAVPKPNLVFATSPILALLVFWWMDAKYLQLERQYRALFNDVRSDGKVERFDMNPSGYLSKVPTVLELALTWSIGYIYFILIVAILSIVIGLYHLS